MGAKKARAAKILLQREQQRVIGLRQSGTCLTYGASNGGQYRIDVMQMEQVNIQTGTRRKVHRRQGQGKNGIMWLCEGQRAAGCSDARSKVSLNQYPKAVCTALENCIRAALIISTTEETEGENAARLMRSVATWRDKLEDLPKHQLQIVFLRWIAAIWAQKDDALREVLLELALRQHEWPPKKVAQVVKWLIVMGLVPTPTHALKAALIHGGLTPLQVLLQQQVDVRNIDLFSDQRLWKGAAAGGRVQKCKAAIKALLARGATLGSCNQPTQSRLLKRLEEDGAIQWAAKVLESLRGERPDLPEPVLAKVAEFIGIQ